MIFKPYRSAQLLEKGITMGNSILATSPVTDLTTVRQQLLVGKLANARHELCILSDEGASDATFYLAKSVVTFFEGDESGAAKLLEKISRPWPPKIVELYGQLLVEGSICKQLMHDVRADLIDTALNKAEQLLTSTHLYSQADAKVYVEILDLLVTDKVNHALALHRTMTDSWGGLIGSTRNLGAGVLTRTDYGNLVVLQNWKLVLDLAMLHLLCKQTKVARRLFSLRRGGDSQYEYEEYAVGVWLDILDSSASKRVKLSATRLFALGHIGF